MNFMKLISNKSSKFGKGVSLQWNIYNSNNNKKFPNNNFPVGIKYNSARSIIYQFLKFINITSEDEILVCGFTCDAVTETIKYFTDHIIAVDVNNDLTMSYDDICSKITCRSRVLILQNTFGRLGLKIDQINNLKSRNIHIIEDCSLSYGSVVNGIQHGNFGDISIFSLEASKAITIGWGGILLINNYKFLKKELMFPRKIPIIIDAKRYMEYIICTNLNKFKLSFGPIIWYFLYCLKVLTKSSTNKFIMENYPGMGILSRKLLSKINQNEEYEKLNKNYIFLYDKLKNNKNIFLPIVPRIDEFIVSPRFPIYVNKKIKNRLLKK